MRVDKIIQFLAQKYGVESHFSYEEEDLSKVVNLSIKFLKKLHDCYLITSN